MQSPVSPNVAMEQATLDPGLVVLQCPDTGGIWIRPSAYWQWREDPERDASRARDENAAGNDLPGTDSSAGKRCPEDGYFLIRHRVGHGLPFHVDRCGHCGGIWLDAGEWEALRSRNLNQDLHLVFTSTWQAKVRQQQRREAQQEFLVEKLGKADAARLHEFAQWLATHPQNRVMLAQLQQQVDHAAEGEP